jgi:hypothetical protein
MSGHPVGLLLNFNVERLKAGGIVRKVNRHGDSLSAHLCVVPPVALR